MKVGSLRDCNVTLHLSMTQKREQVPDMPAVYLVCKANCIKYYVDELNEPTIKKIAEDAMNGLYDYFFINIIKNVQPE